MRRALLKSCVYVGRYLRQPIEWVEALTLDQLNEWGSVLTELLLEERGAQVDQEVKDPWGLLRSED